jgi:uncharacterized protein YneF (UPF0154 family)
MGNLWRHILGLTVIFLIIIFLGAYIYQQVEDWRYLDSVYFVVVTVTTVGYGDLVPKTDLGKIITIIFPLIGMVLAFYFVSMIGRFLLRQQFRARLVKDGRITGTRGVKRISSKKKKTKKSKRKKKK